MNLERNSPYEQQAQHWYPVNNPTPTSIDEWFSWRFIKKWLYDRFWNWLKSWNNSMKMQKMNLANKTKITMPFGTEMVALKNYFIFFVERPLICSHGPGCRNAYAAAWRRVIKLQGGAGLPEEALAAASPPFNCRRSAARCSSNSS